jgi:hypothetical protein
MSTREFRPRSWFWLVGAEHALWSSAAAIEVGSFAAGYVDADDPAYAAFLEAGALPTKIGSEIEIRGQSIAVVPGLAMLSRLTEPEYVAIRQAEAASPATIGRWLDALRVNGEVNLFGLTAEAARAGLVAAGLLTEVRASEIFRLGA